MTPTSEISNEALIEKCELNMKRSVVIYTDEHPLQQLLTRFKSLTENREKLVDEVIQAVVQCEYREGVDLDELRKLLKGII